jgi:molybdopterin molybdotransferase
VRTVAEHQALVARLVGAGRPLTLSLCAAAGRVLAQDYFAREPLPAFDNAAMDGYAVRAADIAGASPVNPVILPVVEHIPAGRACTPAVRPGTAHRIMTGAPMPAGADTVVRHEATDGGGTTVAIRQSPPPGRDIRQAGEESAAGDRVATSGTVLGPAHLGQLAATGISEVLVRSKVRVLIVSAGSELARPGEPRLRGQIFDSNSVMLAAAVTACGAEAICAPFAPDDAARFLDTVRADLPRADLVLTSGGVSAGAYDVVKAALARQGVDFFPVAMQPGKPQGAGRYLGIPLVALPGYPVSALVSFEMFVRPALLAAMGFTVTARPVAPARLAAPASSRPGYRAIRHGTYDAVQQTVRLIEPKYSRFLRQVADANCQLEIDEATTFLGAGEEVLISLLN